MPTLMHLGNQIGGTNVVNSLDSDSTTSAVSAKKAKELNENKADRDQITSASDVWVTPHTGGYKVGDIVIHDNTIYECITAQAQGSEVSPTAASGSTYWTASSVLSALKSSLANSIKFVKQNITLPNDMSSKPLGSNVSFTTSVPNNCVAIAVIVYVFGQDRIMNNCFDQIATYSSVTGVTSRITFPNAYDSAQGFILYMKY